VDQDVKSKEPATAKEWIEACLTAVVEFQKQDQDQDEDKDAPMKPNAETMTGEEYDAAAERYDNWMLRRFLNGAASKGQGNLNKAATAQAFLQAMPPLTTRANTKAFIACLATGLQRQYMTGTEVKMLMYTAQLALQAHQPRAKRRTTPLGAS
jgi:hypothetical protein